VYCHDRKSLKIKKRALAVDAFNNRIRREIDSEEVGMSRHLRVDTDLVSVLTPPSPMVRLMEKWVIEKDWYDGLGGRSRY
jgi:hypothetical protein